MDEVLAIVGLLITTALATFKAYRDEAKRRILGVYTVLAVGFASLVLLFGDTALKALDALGG